MCTNICLCRCIDACMHQKSQRPSYTSNTSRSLAYSHAPAQYKVLRVNYRITRSRPQSLCHPLAKTCPAFYCFSPSTIICNVILQDISLHYSTLHYYTTLHHVGKTWNIEILLKYIIMRLCRYANYANMPLSRSDNCRKFWETRNHGSRGTCANFRNMPTHFCRAY